MTYRSNGHARIHSNVLAPSSPDTIALGLAVEERFNAVFNLHVRLRGLQLAVPQSLDKDMLRWRTMRVRHKSGDLRNSEEELRSTKSIAQWTCDTNSIVREQPIKAVVWP